MSVKWLCSLYYSIHSVNRKLINMYSILLYLQCMSASKNNRLLVKVVLLVCVSISWRFWSYRSAIRSSFTHHEVPSVSHAPLFYHSLSPHSSVLLSLYHSFTLYHSIRVPSCWKLLIDSFSIATAVNQNAILFQVKLFDFFIENIATTLSTAVILINITIEWIWGVSSFHSSFMLRWVSFTFTSHSFRCAESRNNFENYGMRRCIWFISWYERSYSGIHFTTVIHNVPIRL